MRRGILLLAALLSLGACASETTPAPPPTTATAGTEALGEPIDSLEALTSWVQAETGECASPAPATRAELTDYLGRVRVSWYAPFVSEWATCAIAPYGKLGLVLFEEGQQEAMQEFWHEALTAGRITDNPDWAFGNGFAITAGPLGTERLGLHYLWCTPAEVEAHTIPADVPGCVYANPAHHH